MMEIIRQAFIFGALCSEVYLLYRILRTCHQIGQMVEAAINEFYNEIDRRRNQ